MNLLKKISAQNSRLCAGLISGTSADGVDAALVRVRGTGSSLSIEIIRHDTLPYPAPLRERVLTAARAPAGGIAAETGGIAAEIAGLDFEVGRFFAETVKKIAADAGIELSEIDLVGSHGQTIFHAPPRGDRPGATLQIGNGCVIAAECGLVALSDFRAADMAAGGEGAPLAPYLDRILFRDLEDTTVALNLGGIANVTFVPGADTAGGKDLSSLSGFDTGPANMILDGLAERVLPGNPPCDREGRAAALGKVDRSLLERLLEGEYFKRLPPKSTGREMFGSGYVDRMLEWGKGLSPEGLLATAAALVALSVTRAIEDFMDPEIAPPARVVASGGGVHNTTLMTMLSERFSPVPVHPSSHFGVPVDGKEAVLFAVLASETISGTTANLPDATGARHPVFLGKISLPPPAGNAK